jgi:hypothetical protein
MMKSKSQVLQRKLVFAPEERDVYSQKVTLKELAPLGAKPGDGTIADAGQGDCAPTELNSKEGTVRL